MTTPTVPLFRASWKMMLRSRGVIFAIVTASLYIAFFGLIEDLDFGVGGETIRFFDFVLPGFAVFLMVYQIQDITVAVGASYKARGILALTANLLWLIPLIALVAVTSIAMAFGIAGFTPNPQTATNVGGTVSFLMFGFSGVMFPTEALPGLLPHIVPYAVPHTALIEAIRGIALTGEGITAYGHQILVGAVWLAVALTVAARAYRLTDE